MRFLSRTALLVLAPFAFTLGACGPFSPPSTSGFYQAHQPTLFLKEALGATDLSTSNAFRSTFGSKLNSYEAEFFISLTTSAYPGSPEELIQEYQDVVFQDMEAVDLVAEASEMEGSGPGQKWVYTSEDYQGEISIRVSPTEDDQLTIKIWTSEQSR